MKENKLNEKLFELLSSKKFESLTQEEKQFVLTEMEPDEYNHLFELQHSIHTSLHENSAAPSKNLKSNLLTAFDNHHNEKQNKKGVLRFLFMKVPAYQSIAAAVLAFVLSSGFYLLNNFNSISGEHIVYKFKTDTVYVQSNPIHTIDTIEIVKPIQQTIQPSIQNQNKSTSEKVNTESLCRSIKTDSELKQFMVSL
ncbi:MAG: hypothetical protein WCI97_00340 [Bacteroidota bacterium]